MSSFSQAATVDSINQILPTAKAGYYSPGYYDEEEEDAGGKALEIRIGIRPVLRKIVYYKAEHQRYVNEAGSTLRHALPHDIVTNNVLSFLELPLHTFVLEDLEDGEIGDWEGLEDEEDDSSEDGSSEDDEEE